MEEEEEEEGMRVPFRCACLGLVKTDDIDDIKDDADDDGCGGRNITLSSPLPPPP